MSIFTDIGHFLSNGLASVPHWLKSLAEKGLQISKAFQEWLKSDKVIGIEKAIDSVSAGLGTEIVTEVTAFAQSVDSVLTAMDGVVINDKHKELITNALLQKTQSYTTALQDNQKHPESTYDKASQLVYTKKS